MRRSPRWRRGCRGCSSVRGRCHPPAPDTAPRCHAACRSRSPAPSPAPRLSPGSHAAKTRSTRTASTLVCTLQHVHLGRYTSAGTPQQVHNTKYTTARTPQQVHYTKYTTARTPRQVHYTKYTTARTPRQVHYTKYTTARTPRQVHYTKYTTARTPRQVHYTTYTSAGTLHQVHYSTYTSAGTLHQVHYTKYTTACTKVQPGMRYRRGLAKMTMLFWHFIITTSGEYQNYICIVKIVIIKLVVLIFGRVTALWQRYFERCFNIFITINFQLNIIFK